MRISENGKAFIRNEEGEVLKVYADQIGIPTAGIGHVVKDMKVGTPITKEQSRAWFANDIKRFEDGVGMAVKVPLEQHQFDALVSFSFNVGNGNFLSSTMLKLLNANKFLEAADQFPRWNKAGGKVLPVLTRRRARERKLFLEGVYA